MGYTRSRPGYGLTVSGESTPAGPAAPVLVSATVTENGQYLHVLFDQVVAGSNGFTVTINGEPADIFFEENIGNALSYGFDGTSAVAGNTVLLSYTPGDIKDNTDTTPLAAFSNFAVVNNADEQLTPDFTADSTSGSDPLVVHFTDTTVGTPDSYSWNFGDGTTSTEQSPTKTYTTAGTYTVTLVVENALGQQQNIKTNYITVTGFLAAQTGYALGWTAEKAYTNTARTTPATTNGQNVHGLDDLSGNSRHGIQSTAGNTPLYQIVGGLPALKFPGTSSRTIQTNGAMFDSTWNTSFTLYLVKEYQGLAGPKVLVGGNSTNLFLADDRSATPSMTHDWYTGGNGARHFDYDDGNIVALCVKYDGTAKRAEVYATTGSGQVVTSTVSFNLGLTGAFLLGDISQGGGFAWFGFFYAAHLYKAQHNNTTIGNVLAYLRTKYLTEPSAITGATGNGNYKFIHDGDSLTVGQGVAAGSDYPTQLNTLLGAGYSFSNTAVGGQTAAEANSDAETQVDALYDTNAKINLCWAWMGTNDMQYGVNPNIAYRRYRDYCLRRKYKGFKVMAFTVLPRSDGGGLAGFETKRQAFNTLVRNNYTQFAERLVDVAANTTIGDSGDENNTTYYQSDKVHLTAAGQTIIRDLANTEWLALKAALGI